MLTRMSYIFRAVFILLALVCSTSAEFVSHASLCLFKGHLKYSPTEIIYWLEEKGSQCDMPFYTMSELGLSNFKSIKLALNDESKGDALIYLYHNRQGEDQNVAFVNFEKTAYHFSGSEELAFEKFKKVGGEKVVVDFGSCVKGEYRWDFQVASTEGTIGGYVKRDYF
ncbi:uncharacterized protein V1513DRAFT_332997 [Lipomyces chichibuensis]|uniref:uncharacterized protein n=1 Tax=Lipomyces chichibuensis TaxID=1546026 RepID=UPI0033441B04